MSDQEVKIRPYEEFIGSFMQLYNEKKYAEALAFLEQDMHLYPDNQALIYYNRACMLGVQNLLSESLAVLREAKERGYWFRAKMLHDDPDFAGLQGNPDFEALATHFQQRFEAVAANVHTLRIVSEPPATTPKPYPLLLTLHGNNSNATATSAHYTAAANAGWLVANLQASQLSLTENSFEWNNVEQSVADVNQHHTELTQGYPVDAQRVVVSGFSMGGQIASLLAVTQPFAVKGLIGIGTYLDDEHEKWTEQIATLAERGVRVFLIVGDKDEHCYPGTLRFAELLRAANVPCELKVYAGLGHVYPPDFDEVLVTALNFITG